jgi:hypothetical protein
MARRIRLTAPNPTQRISRSRQITSNIWAGRPILAAEANLSPNPEASREQFATCRPPHGNREGPTFHSKYRKNRKPPIMMASSGCFFAHLSYSLRTARLASSFLMLAMQTPS